MRRLDLEFENRRPITEKNALATLVCFQDNRSTITLVESENQSRIRKFMDLRYHWLVERVELVDIILLYVRTDNQLADILTKPLGRIVFTKLRSQIGVKDVKDPQEVDIYLIESLSQTSKQFSQQMTKSQHKKKQKKEAPLLASGGASE